MRKLMMPVLLALLFSSCTLDQREVNMGCVVEKQVRIHGNSLEPLFSSDEIVPGMLGFQECNDIERGMFVLYNYSGIEGSLLKIVKAVPGDSWSVTNMSIYVNGKELRTTEGERYSVVANRGHLLRSYVQDYPTIPNSTYLLFGDVPNSIDAGRFGLVHESDIIGVVKG